MNIKCPFGTAADNKSRTEMFGNLEPHFYWHGPHEKTEVGPQLVKSNSRLFFTLWSPLTDTFFLVTKKLSLPELTTLFPSPLLNLIWTKIDEQTLKHSRVTMAVGPGSLVCRGPSCLKSFYGGSYTLVSLDPWGTRIGLS
jgi:hypothetical protein